MVTRTTAPGTSTAATGVKQTDITDFIKKRNEGQVSDELFNQFRATGQIPTIQPLVSSSTDTVTSVPNKAGSLSGAAPAPYRESNIGPVAPDGRIYRVRGDYTETPGTDYGPSAYDQKYAPIKPLSAGEEQRGLLQERRNAESKLGTELFGEDNPVDSSLEAELNRIKASKAADLQYAQSQSATATQLDQAALDRAKKEGTASAAGIKASLAQDREGPLSLGNVEVSKKLATEVQSRIDEAQTRFNAAEQTRANALRKMEEAQRSGNKELVKAFQQQLASAEREIQQAQTDHLNALSQAQETALKTQESTRKNVSTFQALIESGASLTPESVRSLSTQLDIPFEAAFDFYQGSAAIRNDKSLSNEEKQIAIQQKKQELDNEIAGITTTQAKNVAYFEKLRKSGTLSQQELFDIGRALGVDQGNDPLVQAEVALKQAQAKIATAEANGEIINPTDRLNYFKLQAEVNEMLGIGGEAYVPNKSLEGITTEYKGGKLVITPAKNVDGSLKPMQCGEFVNRTWGLSSGGSGGFGSKYNSKKNIVNKNGVKASSIDPLQFSSIVKPGMAFVSEAGSTGHTGIVTQVFPDGTFVTMEANTIGDTGPGSPPIEKTRNLKDSDLYGFAAPPNYTSVQGTNGKSKIDESTIQGKILKKFTDLADQYNYQGKEKQEFIDKRIDASYAPLTESQGKALKAIQVAQNEGTRYEDIVGVIDPEVLAGSVNFLSQQIKDGSATLTAQLINQHVPDANARRAIMSEMRWIAAVLREESGAAISVDEYTTKGAAFFPRAGDDAKTLADKENARKVEIESLKSKVGPAGERILLEQEASSSQPLSEIDYYEQAGELTPETDSWLDSIFAS